MLNVEGVLPKSLFVIASPEFIEGRGNIEMSNACPPSLSFRSVITRLDRVIQIFLCSPIIGINIIIRVIYGFAIDFLENLWHNNASYSGEH